MTVKDLIAQLQAMPENTPLILEDHGDYHPFRQVYGFSIECKNMKELCAGSYGSEAEELQGATEKVEDLGLSIDDKMCIFSFPF